MPKVTQLVSGRARIFRMSRKTSNNRLILILTSFLTLLRISCTKLILYFSFSFNLWIGGVIIHLIVTVIDLIILNRLTILG